MLKALLPLLLLAGCGQDQAPPPAKLEKAKAQPPRQSAVPAPAEPGGLPVDRPLFEAPAETGGAQEAATVLETYYALIEGGKYREAWKLRSTERGGSEAAFVDSFGRYASYRAAVGTPSQVARAGEWLYVEVPVQLYVRTKSGEPSSSAGSVTLRRKENRSADWRIYS